MKNQNFFTYSSQCNYMLKNLYFFLHIKPCMSIYIHFCQTANCNTFLSASLDKKKKIQSEKREVKSTRWDYLIWFNQTLRLNVMHNIFLFMQPETREINLWSLFAIVYYSWNDFRSLELIGSGMDSFMRVVKVNLL